MEGVAETTSTTAAGGATDLPDKQSCLDDEFEKDMEAFFDYILRDEPGEAATVKQVQRKLAPMKAALKSRAARNSNSQRAGSRRVRFKLPASPASLPK